MDTSKEYIKMCEGAEEIQTIKCLYDLGQIGIKVVGADWFYLYDTDTSFPKIIWLPRQDQLQEMVEGEPLQQLYRFNEWLTDCAKEPENYHHNFENSMEQLWLAFVMKEKYQKTWDGEKWQLSKQ